MNLMMRIVVPFTFVMSIAVGAHAQMWGAGMYGGMQACPYPYAPAQGATSDLDGVREAQDAIDEAKRELSKKKRELKRISKQVDRWETVIQDNIRSDAVDSILSHMQNPRMCREYKGWRGRSASNFEFDSNRMPASEPGNAPDIIDEDTDTMAEAPAGGSEGDRGLSAGDKGGKLDHPGISDGEWAKICGDKGSISPEACSVLRAEESGPRGRRGQAYCGKAMIEYRRDYAMQGRLQDEINDLEDSIERYRDDKRTAIQEARDEAEERRRDELEGGVCLDCLVQSNSYAYQRPPTDWASVFGNVGLGLVSMYAGYRTNKMVANANANIGWPTDPWASQGYGYGLGAIGTALGQVVGGGSGIYGAMGGGIGQGGFGCAGNNGGPYGMMGPYGGMNGNGMWGNPYGMAGLGFPGMGGGMFNPGMGPWGMGGPFGGFGGGFPGMGGPFGGMGGPFGGMGGPFGGLGGGFGGGFPGMGGPFGGMGGPFGGMGGPFGGLGGGFGGGFPGMGGPFGGMGGPFGGLGGGFGGGFPGMGGPFGGMGGLGGMGMQQQMMQMQMQQYQMYMQQQQQYVQQQMQRQQVVASLQQELYGLLARIQQVQYGGGLMGGSIGGGLGGSFGGGFGGGFGGSGGFGGGSNLSVIPGSGGSGSSGGIPSAR